VSSYPLLQREVTLGGTKCEDTRISEVQSYKIIPVVRWKGHVAEDMPFWRKSLWEKRGCVGQEIPKARESEFI
jgi:hypothetical protein